MVKKVLFLGDYYRNGQSKNIRGLYSLVSPLFFDSGIFCEPIYHERKYVNEDVYKASLSGVGVSVFRDFNIDESTGIIGFELNPIDIKYLNDKGIPWINFDIHPVRFLKDLCYSITASFDFDFSNIQITAQEIKFSANIIKFKFNQNVPNLSQNSLLVLAQVPDDKSVFFDGQYKNLLDYSTTLEILSQKYDKVYIKPHPFIPVSYTNSILEKKFNAEVLTEYSFYELMSCNEIASVCGISSSSLHEAQYFDKEVIFLEQKKKIFSKPIFIQEFLNSHRLWINFFTGDGISLSNQNFQISSNTCRDLYEYWSYETPLQKLGVSVQAISNIVDQNKVHAQNAEQKANEAQFQADNAEQHALESERIAHEANLRAEHAEQKANEAQFQADNAGQHALESERIAHEANSRAEHAEQKANEAQFQADNAWHHYNLVVNSNSWTLMKPLRIVGQFARWFVRGSYHWLTFSPTSRPRRVAKQKLILLKHYINARPILKYKIINFLNHFPKLKARLKRIGQTQTHSVVFEAQSLHVKENTNDMQTYEQLTPRAKEIYYQLKAAIEENRKSVQ